MYFSFVLSCQNVSTADNNDDNDNDDDSDDDDEAAWLSRGVKLKTHNE